MLSNFSNEDYLQSVKRHFNLDDELRATVYTVQSFVELGVMEEDEAITFFGITRQQYEQYKELPKS